MKQKLAYAVEILLCISVLLIDSCQREINFPKTAETITTSVSGRILDEKGLPVQGAFVSIEASQTITDINGNFDFTDIRLHNDAGFIKVVKQGFFLGSRTITAKTNSTHFAEIELIPKKVAGKFEAAAGGKITIPNGGSVQFDANTVVNSSTQTAYTGEVSVAAHFLDPSAENFSAIMPGDLRGITSSNEEKALQSFGMLAVELSGSGGESLQLASGKSATLTFPIPASLLQQSPQSIPLWYFDETTGLWTEQGSATKQGNNYIGNVAHFSFWNVDKPYALVDFEALIMNEAEQLLPYTKVEIRMQGDSASTSGSGFTDAQGRVSGKIPANQKLQLLVIDKCNQVMKSISIGPFSNTANLETIKVPNGGNAVINFSGTVKNCNDEGVTDGFVNILINGANYRTKINKGTFTFSVTTCSNNLGRAIVTGFDNSTNTASDTVAVLISASSNYSVALKACGNLADEFIKFALNGNNYTSVRPNDSLNCYRNNTITYVEGYTIGNMGWQDFAFKFNSAAAAPGTYYIYGSGISIEGIRYSMKDSIFVNITEYGAKGDYVAGNFSGNLKRDSLNTLYPINCNFRIKRTN